MRLAIPSKVKPRIVFAIIEMGKVIPLQFKARVIG
jgi:hypothetical protein